MPLNIYHEDLRQNIWINKKEISNNGLDDDNNGYIDDINGWNFIGNVNGETSKFVNYEYTRILKKYDSDFENNLITDSLLYKTYLRARDKYEKRLQYAIEDTSYINIQKRGKSLAKETLSKFFIDDNYSIKDLDSLKNLHPKDSIIKLHTRWMKALIKYEFTDEYIDLYKLKADERLDKLLNKDYNDRIIIGDNSDSLNEKNYGSPEINIYNGFFDHGTLIAGLIAARRDNNIGTKGISDNIKIMPLSISAFGDEHDKDIALAIRYAVDNGARVINMSFGKEFSLYKKWVFDAIKYAEQNDVLIVKSAGNNGKDLEYFEVYPNDNNYFNREEVADNFLMVGATNYYINKNMIPSFSNYGSSNVDVFAPGVEIYTTSVTKEKYELIDGGTSLSCAVTSGVAALVRSHYPNLTASQVKHILMDSGLEYTYDVRVNDTLLPFNQLSKSGKVINAYNALIMADSISKKK
nr:S8 family serine peptidase [uncultured Winogradskyella sp.]